METTFTPLQQQGLTVSVHNPGGNTIVENQETYQKPLPQKLPAVGKLTMVLQQIFVIGQARIYLGQSAFSCLYSKSYKSLHFSSCVAGRWSQNYVGGAVISDFGSTAPQLTQVFSTHFFDIFQPLLLSSEIAPPKFSVANST